MTRLVVTADAEADTFEILNDLENKAGAATAARYAQRFRAAIQRILELPQSGARRHALGPDARRIIVLPYILIYDYTAEDDTLVLLRILHGRRRIARDTRQRRD
jgi:toxin ParE1/3/4